MQYTLVNTFVMHRDTISDWIAQVEAESESCGWGHFLKKVGKLQLKQSSTLKGPSRVFGDGWEKVSNSSLSLACNLKKSVNYCSPGRFSIAHIAKSLLFA